MNFWKSFGASMLAVGICTFVAIFFLVSLIIGLANSFETEPPTTKSESVLYITLNENITDAPSASAFGNINTTSMSMDTPTTLLEVIGAIEYAATDSHIKGICIKPYGMGVISSANIEELRQALQRFKLSGKFIVAYDEIYTQSDYYLATVADKILLQPEGSLDWCGLSAMTMFYKGLLDRLDVTVDIFRPTDCKFKSAVEPFIRSNMSAENREQMNTLVNSMWNDIVDEIALSRNLRAEQLKMYARELSINSAEDALNVGMIDMVAYEDALFDIYDGYNVKRNSSGTHNIVTLGEYISSLINKRPRISVDDDSALSISREPLVAVIYAEGEIVDGNMYADGYVYGSRLAAELRKARLDDRTKAVVVRVNSPGGSAIASDIAWREMVLLQQTKPVVISMGEMAASGGYYISAPADYIIADKLTLTGSIGVFGAFFNLESALKNKLGITIDNSFTSPSAGGFNYLSPLTKDQRRAIMESVDNIYTTFTSHVAEGRNLAIEDVLKIAEGRVWSGSDAVKIGLVDAIGGFNEAIYKAVELADIDDNFTIYEFVAPFTPFEQWLDSMGLLYANMWGIDYNIYGSELRTLFTELPHIITCHGIQTYVPGNLKIEL